MPGLEVIKLEYRLKIKRVSKQPIIALYFESENELNFFTLEARLHGNHFEFTCSGDVET